MVKKILRVEPFQRINGYAKVYLVSNTKDTDNFLRLHACRLEADANFWHNRFSYMDESDVYDAIVDAFYESAENFDPSKGEFSTYYSKIVYYRIRSKLRAIDTVPRLVRDRLKILNKLVSGVCLSLGREASDFDVAVSLNGGALDEGVFSLLEDIAMTRSDVRPTTQFGRHSDTEHDTFEEESLASPGDFVRALTAHDLLLYIAGNPIFDDKEKGVFVGYYLEGRLEREVAVTLGVSESRVCQILNSKVKPKLALLGRRFAREGLLSA